MTTTVTPLLMFQGGCCEAAMALYVSLFEDAAMVDVQRFSAGSAGPEGSIMMATFKLAGRDFRCNDSPVKHAFDFTPSMSIFVDCADEAELDRIYAALAEGGEALMPLGAYGFSRKFGWLNDRFGVSWQLNLPL